MHIIELMSANAALELTNTAGERILRINKQLENIQKSIMEESLKGHRCITLLGQLLAEVIDIIRAMGYDYEVFCGKIYIRW